MLMWQNSRGSVALSAVELVIPFAAIAYVGIYGLSYGGLNAMQALTRNSDVFAAVRLHHCRLEA